MSCHCSVEVSTGCTGAPGSFLLGGIHTGRLYSGVATLVYLGFAFLVHARTLNRPKTCCFLHLNTHRSHKKHIAHDLLDDCCNHTILKIRSTRLFKMQFVVCFRHTCGLETRSSCLTYPRSLKIIRMGEAERVEPLSKVCYLSHLWCPKKSQR